MPSRLPFHALPSSSFCAEHSALLQSCCIKQSRWCGSAVARRSCDCAQDDRWGWHTGQQFYDLRCGWASFLSDVVLRHTTLLRQGSTNSFSLKSKARTSL